jgi:hypothetical protein
MPHLIVTADTSSRGEGFVLAEELTPAQFANQHRRDQLLERVEWALDDAAAAEEANPRLREASGLAERLHGWFG